MPKYVVTCVRTIYYTLQVEAENEEQAHAIAKDTDYDKWHAFDDTSYLEDDTPEVEE